MHYIHSRREMEEPSENLQRLVCLECGYDFDLSCTTHREMLEASKLSFDRADSSLFIRIFSKAVVPYGSPTEG